jgi:hypothetical protein
MHLLQCQANLLQFLNRLLLGESLALLDESEEVAAVHVLHDDIEVRGVVEEPVERDDVGVVQEELDLDLVYELL